MKKNILIIAIGIIAFTFNSCSDDFTDLAPQSQRNVENFYNTSGDMEVAVNAIYNMLHAGGCYNQSYWVMQELRGDNSFWDGTGLAREISVFDKFEEFPTSNITREAWDDTYLGVARANIVLDRIGGVDMDAGLKDQYVGEALFLRSLYYYHLAVAFGNIPLVTNEPSSVEEGLAHVQVSATEVYNQLITDLTEAESKLAVSYSGSDLGRATKGAAATLMAKVYLTMGDNTNAASTLRRIISSYGYSLTSNYAGLWGVENEHNAESIFEVEFAGGLSNQGNSFTNDFSAPLPTSVSGQRNIPELDLIAAYEDGDTRFSSTIDTAYTDDAGMFHSLSTDETRWTNKWGTTNAFQEGDAPNNWIVFRYADVLLMLAEAIGEGTEAYGLINEVRARAGLGTIDAGTPGTFVDKLLKERRIEFAFENHRWADLLRLGQADAIMSAQGKSPQGRLLFAIPQRELDLNSSFTQNPGF